MKEYSFRVDTLKDPITEDEFPVLIALDEDSAALLEEVQDK